MKDFHIHTIHESDDAFRGIDPRIKLVLAVAALVLVVCASNLVFPAIVFAGIWVSLICSTPNIGRLLHRSLPGLAIVMVLTLMQALLVGTDAVYRFSLGGVRISLMREGLLLGLYMAVRVLACFGVLFWLMSSAPVHELLVALRWFGVPAVLLELSMLAYRYVFELRDQANRIVAAQKLRLGYASFFNAIRSVCCLLGLILVHAVEQSNRTCEAMVARGFDGGSPIERLEPISRGKILVGLLGLVLMISLFVVCELVG